MFPNDYAIELMVSEGWDLDDSGQLLKPGEIPFITKQKPTRDNPYCHIDKFVDGKHYQVLRSRLVCWLALGKPSLKNNICDHKDGNKFNDHPGNLEWVTQSQNCQNVSEEVKEQRRKNLEKARAKNFKLSNDDLNSARRKRWLASERIVDLARKYGVSKRYMMEIVNYKVRPNVEDRLYPNLKFEVMGHDEAA